MGRAGHLAGCPPGETLDPEAGEDTDSWTPRKGYSLWRAEVSLWAGLAGGQGQQGGERKQDQARGACPGALFAGRGSMDMMS